VETLAQAGAQMRGRLDPAVAAVRVAVRRSLADLRQGSLVLVACSGGADSLALASAVAFEAPRSGVRAGAVTVDHGLQAGSAGQAKRVVTTMEGLGLDPVRSVAARVTARQAGPEAAARQARYAAIEAVAAESGAAAVLLGHTMDDQAETVLLGLARGSGARSLAGMDPVSGCYLRPLLGLRRSQTQSACAALGLRPWADPHNADPAYARARVRHQVLPLMEELLGPGITEALARTADQLRADADMLDSLAATAAQSMVSEQSMASDEQPGSLDAAALAALPAPIRTRVLRGAAIAAGSPAGSLTAQHVASLDALVMAWHGQGRADLPGAIACERRYGRLHFTTRS
jgi:tRNA(Ile)-lysidine synthase